MDDELKTMLTQSYEVLQQKLDSNMQMYIAQKAKADEVRRQYVAFENLKINQKASGAGKNPDSNAFHNTIMKEWNYLQQIEASRQQILVSQAAVKQKIDAAVQARRALKET